MQFLLGHFFPVLALTAAFLLMFPIGFVIERIIGRPVDFSIVATALLRDGVGWVLVRESLFWRADSSCTFCLTDGRGRKRESWQAKSE